MIVVDTNVLIYAAHAGAPQHQATARWLEQGLAGSQVLGLPWVSALGFVRITTSSRVFSDPFTPEEALGFLEDWHTHPAVTVPEPTTRHLVVLGGLLRQSGTAGNLTTDAHIAALAIEHGASVASFDRDLGRFGIPVLVPGD